MSSQCSVKDAMSKQTLLLTERKNNSSRQQKMHSLRLVYAKMIVFCSEECLACQMFFAKRT